VHKAAAENARIRAVLPVSDGTHYPEGAEILDGLGSRRYDGRLKRELSGSIA
jgi:hypothetical protein